MPNHETAPGVCPICLTHPLKQIAPQLWDCTSRRCNSQFYVDSERLLAVRDRVPKELGVFGRKRLLAVRGCGFATYIRAAIALFIFALFALWSEREGIAAILGVLAAGAMHFAWRRA